MFNLEHKNSGELIIYPSGELDIYTAPQFKKEVLEYYEDNKNNILIDASNLEYVDSTGLGAIIYILNKISENNHKVALINVRHSIKKLFTITKLDSVFEMRD